MTNQINIPTFAEFLEEETAQHLWMNKREWTDEFLSTINRTWGETIFELQKRYEHLRKYIPENLDDIYNKVVSLYGSNYESLTDDELLLCQTFQFYVANWLYYIYPNDYVAGWE